MITLSWFGLGILVGAAIMEIIVLTILKCDSNKLTNKEFVKKLIEKEGWDGANTILTFEFGGKYLNIWRRLYREYIEKGENK